MSKWLLILLACLLGAANAMAQVGIPDSARPGASRPQEVDETAATEMPDTDQLYIPAYIERPLEVDEGDRVAVKEFRLIDATDMPEYGVSIVEIQELLQKLIDAKPEGFTIGQLEEATDLVTNYYREKQLILSKAVIPVQTVTEGVVDLQVMPGILGRVITVGNEMYSEDLLVEPFRNLVGKPVTKDGIESALLSLTDFPGLTVFGVFQPGRVVGEADIVLNVQEEKRWDALYRVDNQGVEETGRFRFRPSLTWNNPTGSADQLTLLLQQAYRPKNNIFVNARYNRYLGYGFRAEVSWDKNEFDVGGELKDSEIQGVTTNMDGNIFKNWVRGRTFNLYSELGLSRKESITTREGEPANEDKLSVLRANVNFDHVDTRLRGINFGGITYSRGFNNFMGSMGNIAQANLLKADGRAPSVEGKRITGSSVNQFAEGRFNKFEAYFTRLQTITLHMRLQLDLEYQWTDDLLVPLEQYSVGGPDNLRAYPPGQYLMDRALFVSVELFHDIPFITDKPAFGNRTWGELVTISGFYQFARGRLVRPFSDEDIGNKIFMGAGVMATFALPGAFESRFITAWDISIGGGEETDPNNLKKPQIWGDLTYRF